MGMYFIYKCLTCDYEYEGTGGRSSGIQSIVYDTYNCHDCKTTFDYRIDPSQLARTNVLVPIPKTFLDKLLFRKQKFLQDYEYDKIPDSEIGCKNCNKNNVEFWAKKCPRCAGEMKMKMFGGMWD